jgi:hypothetical protein
LLKLPPFSFWFCCNEEATAIVVIAFFFGFVVAKKAMAITNYHHFLHFGCVATKKTTIITIIAFIFLV